MFDDGLTYVNVMISKKKKLINNSKSYIETLLADVQSAKRQIHKTKDVYNNSSIKSQIKTYIAIIKQLKKETTRYKKELKIYEAEYKKKQKDPKYNIDYDLLEKNIMKIIWI